MITNIRKWKNEIGILFCLIGIPISSVINEYLKGRNITNIILLLSLFLIFNVGHINKVKKNDDLLILLIFQIYVIGIALLADQSLFEEACGLIYTLFMIAIICLGSTQNKIEDPKHFINTIWWILGIFNFLLFGLITQGGTALAFQSKVRLNYGADRITLSKLSFSFLIVELLRGENGKRNELDIIFTLITVCNIIYCNRRSTIIYFLIVYILHYIYYLPTLKILNKNSTKCILKIMLNILAVIAGTAILFYFVPDLKEKIIYYINSTMNAISTISGRTSSDPSAQVRNELRYQALERLKNHTSLFKLLIGRGYMDNYLDFPFLQAFIDMGLMSIVYIMLQAVLPIKYWFNRTTNVAERFFQYYSMMFFFDNFFAGIPYGYGKFVPLFFLFTQVNVKGKNDSRKYKD